MMGMMGEGMEMDMGSGSMEGMQMEGMDMQGADMKGMQMPEGR